MELLVIEPAEDSQGNRVLGHVFPFSQHWEWLWYFFFHSHTIHGHPDTFDNDHHAAGKEQVISKCTVFHSRYYKKQ